MEVENAEGPVDFVVTPSGYRAALYDADQVRARALESGHLKEPLFQTVDWCEHFLGRPSSLVGRTGNVCPFVPEAMMRCSLKFAVIPLAHQGVAAIAEIEGVVAAFRDQFVGAEEAQGKIDIFGSRIMIFPDVTAEEAFEVIDPPQRKLKPTFVERGLMLGEFHPLSKTPGLRNAAFRPLRSPIPLLAIRHMVESDIDFLIQPSDPAVTRVQSIKAYLQALGTSMSLASQTRAIEALRLAEAELENS
jgi:hypothetical protein